MPDKIQPALTATEWIQYADDLVVMADWAADKRPYGPDRRYTMEEKRHAVAALALHNQSFGFTSADLDALAAVVEFYEHRAFPGDRAIVDKLRGLHGRIEALLPPQAAARVLEKLGE